MKTKTYTIIVLSLFFTLTFVGIIILRGYYESLDGNGGTGVSDARVLSELNTAIQLFKTANTVDEAKSALKLFEQNLGVKKGSPVEVKNKEMFSHYLTVMGARPREGQTKNILGIKRDLLENTVNSYRKELPGGSVPLRAAYLNLLFEIQASLPNDESEEEQVSIRKIKDRLAQLRPFTTGTSDSGLIQRISVLEGGVQSLDKSLAAGKQWNEQKKESLILLEKASNSYAVDVSNLMGGKNSESHKRSFVLWTATFLLLSLLGSILIWLCGKYTHAKIKIRMQEIHSLIDEFGQKTKREKRMVAEHSLSQDGGWKEFVVSIEKSEARVRFDGEKVNSVIQSMGLPVFLFDNEHKLQFWNDFTLDFADGVAADRKVGDLFTEDRFRLKNEGEQVLSLQAMVYSDYVKREKAHEIAVKRGNQWHNFEMLTFSIDEGSLTGGRLLIFRGIRDETLRVEKGVTAQLDRVREVINRLVHNRKVEFTIHENDYLSVRESLLDLEAVKLKLDEREVLWKTEVNALQEQVDRQKDILVRIFDEIEAICSKNQQLYQTLNSIHGVDGDFHSEICLIEKDLERWTKARERVLNDIRKQTETLLRHQEQEKDIRGSILEIQDATNELQATYDSLKKFCENFTIDAINLSFTGSEKDYAERARACAQDMNALVSRIDAIFHAWEGFLRKNPASAKFPLSQGVKFDLVAIDEIQEEQNRVLEFINKWKTDSAALITSGKAALETISKIKESGVMVQQLGETSLLINDQAKSNLQRWN